MWKPLWYAVKVSDIPEHSWGGTSDWADWVHGWMIYNVVFGNAKISQDLQKAVISNFVSE